MKNLLIEIPEPLHHLLRMKVVQERTTVKQFVTRLLEEALQPKKPERR